MYGTTSEGGSNCTSSGSPGCGTVFSIYTAGNETVLYSFGSKSPDAAEPRAKLLNEGGTLYGTTLFGGAYSKGSVFTVATSGQEAVLYSFKGLGTGRPDGKAPFSGLININGKLYGTRSQGGANSGCPHLNGCGTIFSISP